MQAQIWSPNGAQWQYSYNMWWVTGYIDIIYSGDTLIYDSIFYNQHVNCQILKKTKYEYNGYNGELDTVALGAEYTYSNSDTVFLYRHNKFYILYDFSAISGESWEIPETYDSDCDSIGRIKVISNGDTIINSEELRYIDVEPDSASEWSIQGQIIEKIGPVQSYMLPEQYCIPDVYEGGPLRCYQDDSFQYMTGIAPYCDYIVNLEELINDQLKIYPNPAISSIVIECPIFKSYNLRLISILGNSVSNYNGIRNGMIINIEGLLPGIYILYLTDNHSNIKIKKLFIKK